MRRGVAAEAEQLGQRAVELATEPMSRGQAWFWLGDARVLLDDLDGAIDALQKGSVEAIPGGDLSPVSLAMLAGTLHVRGRHEEAWAAATEVFERIKSFNKSGLWAWELYCSLPYALELGQQGRDAEAMAFLRDLLHDSGTPVTPAVLASVAVVLAALAERRGDIEVAALLLDRAGVAMLTQGIRTPVDLALHSHYQAKVNSSIDDARGQPNPGTGGGDEHGRRHLSGPRSRLDQDSSALRARAMSSASTQMASPLSAACALRSGRFARISLRRSSSAASPFSRAA